VELLRLLEVSLLGVAVGQFAERSVKLTQKQCLSWSICWEHVNLSNASEPRSHGKDIFGRGKNDQRDKFPLGFFFSYMSEISQA